MYTKCIHKMSSIINAYLQQQHQQHDEYIDEKEFHKCCLHHNSYCKHLCHKCICCHHHCSLLHCKYTLHNYHYTTYYDINNDNSNNYNQQIDNYYNEINQQQNEPTAPPPSYDQIIPIL
ncbi:hypothetical protein EWB00_005293 [Schistosoma japonicum]|uniref:Uncharacterized protein n=1 Tax=Schistosoma japonicum TaxID=6182 RepID=A0A4Z2D212_SCHJA|nr:hypothetical protein EWB00_005293 [Schistosoma japonicum]